MNNEETRFCFITPAFNCEKSIEQTLKSVYSQSYDNWRMVLINDVSTDKTFAKMHSIVKKLNLTDRVTIVDNAFKHGEVRNTLESVKNIEPEEVVCRLDGGDWLTDNDTLVFLNTVYSQHNPAVCWTAHRWGHSSINISGALPSEDCNVYESLIGERWCCSHLKTFRRDILDDINDANFRDENGVYFQIACDRAIFLPILERARRLGRKRLFLPMVCYHYTIDLENRDLFTNERSVLQRKTADSIHQRGYVE